MLSKSIYKKKHTLNTHFIHIYSIYSLDNGALSEGEHNIFIKGSEKAYPFNFATVFITLESSVNDSILSIDIYISASDCLRLYLWY